MTNFEPWHTQARKTILAHSTFLTVEEHIVQLPDGPQITDWPWIITPDFVNVVAVTRDARFLIFRQTKYAASGVSLAPVGGYIDPGETPVSAAQRELLEETGYRAATWQSLGSYPVDGNRGCGTAHFFLATQAEYAAPINADDLETQELLYLTRNQVETALAAHEFKVLPWAAIMALALRVLDQDDH